MTATIDEKLEEQIRKCYEKATALKNKLRKRQSMQSGKMRKKRNALMYRFAGEILAKHEKYESVFADDENTKNLFEQLINLGKDKIETPKGEPPAESDYSPVTDEERANDKKMDEYYKAHQDRYYLSFAHDYGTDGFDEEKNRAKDLGAKYDREIKEWYIARKDADKNGVFAEWL